MESKNKNSILIIIIAILSVLVIILGAFIYYDKVIKKDNNIMVKEKCSVSETKPEENEIKDDVEDQNKETNNTNQSNNISTNEKNNIVKKYDRVIPDDNCPLTIFDDNYILTDTDKEQIVTSLESLNAGFNRDIIDINSFTIASVSSSGTYMNVRFDTNPKKYEIKRLRSSILQNKSNINKINTLNRTRSPNLKSTRRKNKKSTK